MPHKINENWTRNFERAGLAFRSRVDKMIFLEWKVWKKSLLLCLTFFSNDCVSMKRGVF